MKPNNVFVFILSCLVLLGIASFIFPKEGIKLNDDFTLRFAHWEDMLYDTITYKDVDFVMEIRRDSLFIRDSLSISDSLKLFRNDPNDPTRIKYHEAHKEILYPFFEALDLVRDEKDQLIRVVHYGDSQIEGDRISGYLRDRLQELFGGSGAGLVPALQPIGASSIFQKSSENWVRYAAFGTIEQKADHRRYGAMLAVCKYEGEEAHIQFSKSNIGYARNKNISTVRIYYGQTDGDCSVSLGGKSVPLPASKGVQVVKLSFASLPSSFTLQFNGPSPEVYGIAMDGGPGVTVDNVPMRGSSGTRFTAVEEAGFKKMMDLMQTRLILMEFGGNALPSIKGPKNVENFKSEFKRQLEYMRKVAPDAAIITIGPADMSKSVDGKLQTYPYLEEVNSALKEASFETGCAFWDMYGAMGGRNSMPSWVKQGLAGKDYIHFTRGGSEKIAEIFTQALIDDYNAFRFLKKMERLQSNSTYDTIKK